MKCKYFEKEGATCKHFIGYTTIGRVNGKGLMLREGCKNFCKYVDCKKLEELQGLKEDK